MNYIIVLGNSKENVMIKRLDIAIQEFNKQVETNTFIILSGTKRETDIMYEYTSKYINTQYIIGEIESKNTIDNLVNSKKIVDKLHVSSIIQTITICTSTYHIKRTILISKFIYMGNYIMKYIHTSEQVTEQEYIREANLSDCILNYFCCQLC